MRGFRILGYSLSVLGRKGLEHDGCSLLLLMSVLAEIFGTSYSGMQ